MSSQRNPAINHCASVLLSFSSMFILTFALNLVLDRFSGFSQGSAEYELFRLAIYFAGIALAIFLIKNVTFGKREEEEPAPPLTTGNSVIITVGFTLVLLGVSLALSFVTGEFSKFSHTSAVILLIRCIPGITVKPMLEEYLFRYKYLESVTENRTTFIVFLLIQSVLFSVWHTGSARIIALLAGIAFGIIRKYSGFKFSIASHISYNAVLYIIEICLSAF